ncbi:hypothetical protein XI07_18315 [Bradyrhizobium sp. CCBAU 11445]|uniref:hypothetical protein n=1 Tax=unclassified Bradyrhizobium TaxID=2631580 RepID=UPI002305BB86|nr:MULTISPECIES: hypothetical protein [unclassified Bradyrhizobium]MDA9418913.1 hypothetical protein [Bradyrhizobium sp. CCBAU 25360]MDA9483934.1 hypothetical protein [Bradyrhizobium sp. CCBAU 11445]
MVENLVDTPLIYAALFNFVVWLAVGFVVVKVWRAPVYHPFVIYLLYHFVGFIVRPLLIYLDGKSFIWLRVGITPTSEDIIRVTAIANVALIAAFLGFTFAKRAKSIIPTFAPVRFVVLRPVAFYAAVFVLGVAGLYGTYRAYGDAGLQSVNAFQVTRDAEGGQRLVGISGYTLALAEFLPIICIMLYLCKGSIRTLSIFFIAAFVALRAYIGAQRLSFVVVLVSVFFVSLIEARRRYPGALIIIGVLLGALLFDIVGHDRYVVRRVVLGDADISSIWTSYVADRGSKSSMDVVEFDSATVAAMVVDERAGYSYGTQYLRLLYWPIPRQLWPDKPVFTSIVNLNEYGNFSSMTTTLYVDVYMVYGFVSLIPMMFLLGVVQSRLYDAAVRTTSPLLFTFFWIFLIYFKTILRDGGVTVVYFWAFSMIAAAILIVVGGIRLRRETTGARARQDYPAATALRPSG